MPETIRNETMADEVGQQHLGRLKADGRLEGRWTQGTDSYQLFYSAEFLWDRGSGGGDDEGDGGGDNDGVVMVVGKM